MEIVNLTPHEIVLYGKHGNEVLARYPSTGKARCKLKKTSLGRMSGISLYSMSFGRVSALPAYQKEKLYIVSMMVALAASKRRDDLLFPIDLVRDDQGTVIGCRSFGVFVKQYKQRRREEGTR